MNKGSRKSGSILLFVVIIFFVVVTFSITLSTAAQRVYTTNVITYDSQQSYILAKSILQAYVDELKTDPSHSIQAAFKDLYSFDCEAKGSQTSVSELSYEDTIYEVHVETSCSYRDSVNTRYQYVTMNVSVPVNERFETVSAVFERQISLSENLYMNDELADYLNIYNNYLENGNWLNLALRIYNNKSTWINSGVTYLNHARINGNIYLMSNRLILNILSLQGTVINGRLGTARYQFFSAYRDGDNSVRIGSKASNIFCSLFACAYQLSGIEATTSYAQTGLEYPVDEEGNEIEVTEKELDAYIKSVLLSQGPSGEVCKNNDNSKACKAFVTQVNNGKETITAEEYRLKKDEEGRLNSIPRIIYQKAKKNQSCTVEFNAEEGDITFNGIVDTPDCEILINVPDSSRVTINGKINANNVVVEGDGYFTLNDTIFTSGSINTDYKFTHYE